MLRNCTEDGDSPSAAAVQAAANHLLLLGLTGAVVSESGKGGVVILSGMGRGVEHKRNASDVS